MKYFEQYRSNTYAGSANQLYFNMHEGEIRTGRVFYKISVQGEYGYSILFSNIIDSTFADGSVSYKNFICDNWRIHSARIGRCKTFGADVNAEEITMSDEAENGDADIIISDWKDLTFNGKCEKEVVPGEVFSSDGITLYFAENEYLCLEITFSGRLIPYHEESIIPVFVKENDGWKYSKYMPFASMVGCDRSVRGRVAYLGDSITQGIGTAVNSYQHWNALLSEKIGDEYAFWNLGIGYGRANDAASDGVWLFKAKQNDIIFVCFGVNDILQGQAEEQIKTDLAHIVDRLKKAGKKVILQTIPPFNYAGENIDKWNRINRYIKTELKDRVDAVFDTVSCLGNREHPHIAEFGGHPNEEGCKIWAEALFEQIKDMF